MKSAFPLLKQPFGSKLCDNKCTILFAEVKKVEEDGEGEGRGGGVGLDLALEPALLPLPRVRGSVRLPLGERSKAH